MPTRLSRTYAGSVGTASEPLIALYEVCRTVNLKGFRFHERAAGNREGLEGPATDNTRSKHRLAIK